MNNKIKLKKIIIKTKSKAKKNKTKKNKSLKQLKGILKITIGIKNMSNTNTNEPRTIIKGGYEIEITKECKVDVLEGISKRTNNPFKIVKQEAWLHTDGVVYPQIYQ